MVILEILSLLICLYVPFTVLLVFVACMEDDKDDES